MPNSSELLPVRLTAAPSPFTNRRDIHRLHPGQSILEILTKIQPEPWLRSQAHVFLEGEEVTPDNWETTIPEPGALLVIRCFPGGGGGGAGKIFRSILTVFVAIAAVAVAAFLPGALGLTGVMGAVVGGLAGAATGVVGTLLVNALIPPAKPKTSAITSTSSDSTTKYSLSGYQNRTNPWGAIPVLLGFLRFVPLKAVRDFSEASGDDQYVRAIFCFGYSQMDISGIRLGETSLSEFENVEKEFLNTIYDSVAYGPGSHTLYASNVHEEALSIKLDGLDYSAIRTGVPGATSISVDITAPSGIINENVVYGYNQGWSINFEVYYRENGTEAWTLGSYYSGWETSKTVWRKSLWFSINPTSHPTKLYDIKVVNKTYAAVTDSQSWDLYWTAIRSFKPGTPINCPDTISTMAMRIKASDQLNGTVSNLSVFGKSWMYTWRSDAKQWIWGPTNNPADLYLHVLTHESNPCPIDVSRIDYDAIQRWHEYCEVKGFAYNRMVDSQVSVLDLLDEIAAAGRAVRAEYNSLWSVVIEEQQTIPKQIFTPRNSWGLEVSLLYPDIPHAFRIPFSNQNIDYQDSERYVLDDNYQIDGYDAWGNWHPEYKQATKFEELQLPGITDPNNIFRHGRYHLAAARLRPREITFKCDFEHLAVTRGDLIYFNHDVMMVGYGSGRIKSIIFDESGNNMLGFTTDEAFEIIEGMKYGVRFRTAHTSGVVSENLIVNPSEGLEGGLYCRMFYLVNSISASSELIPNVGDLLIFGEIGSESIPLIVRSIETSGDLTATLRCVDHAPAIHQADSGKIPGFNPGLIGPTQWLPPMVDNIRSDIGVAIKTPSGPYLTIQVHVTAKSGSSQQNAYQLECQYWPTSNPNDKKTIVSSNTSQFNIYPVDTGVSYSFKVRYIGYQSLMLTLWSETYTHKVVGFSYIPDVTNLIDVYVNDNIQLQWDPVIDTSLGFAIIGYEIRRGRNFSMAQVLDITKTTSYNVTGAGMYWVVARVLNYYSANPAGIEIVGANLAKNIIFTTDEYANGWIGEKISISVNDFGYLELSGAGMVDDIADVDAILNFDNFLNNGDSYDLSLVGYYESTDIVDIGQEQPCVIYATVESVTEDFFNKFDDYPDVDLIDNIDGNLAGLTNVEIQIAIAGDDGVFGDWKKFVSGTYNARKIKMRLKITSTSPRLNALVEAFSWTVDMPDRTESDSAYLDAAGSTITYSRPFQIIPAPQITVYEAEEGDTVILSGKSVSGFTCQVKNGGVGVARTIHWAVKAY